MAFVLESKLQLKKADICLSSCCRVSGAVVLESGFAQGVVELL